LEIKRFGIRVFGIVSKRLRGDCEHFINVGLRDGDGEPRIRGFAGIHDPIVSEAPSMIMGHYLYGTQNIPKRPETYDHGKKNTFKAPLFIYFAPGLPYREQEPRVPETSPSRLERFPARYEK